MAVVVLRKNENITSALLRFFQQVLREGVVADVSKRRYFVSKSEVKRFARIAWNRLRRRRKRRSKKKPKTRLSLKSKVY